MNILVDGIERGAPSGRPVKPLRQVLITYCISQMDPGAGYASTNTKVTLALIKYSQLPPCE